MPPPRRYLDLAGSLSRDLVGWGRGHTSSSDTYLAMRRLHRLTAGRSSQATRAIMRRVPGVLDHVGPAERPQLDEAMSRALGRIRTEGVAMLEPVLTPDEVASLVEFAERGPATARMPDAGERHGSYLELRHDAPAVFLRGTFAWGRPEVQRIMSDERIWDLATAYFGMVPVMHPPQLYWSCAVPPAETERVTVSLARNFHWDYDGIGSLRLHLYLTDVDADAAPMEYVVGSHRPGALRTKALRRADLGETPASALAALGLHEERAIQGPAGTTFISDAGGLHRATRPTGRDRLFLVMPMQAGGFAGYYHHRRLVPARDERFAAALEARRPELRLFEAAAPDSSTVSLLEEPLRR